MNIFVMSQQLLFYWWSLKKQIKGKKGQLGMSTHLTTIILTFTSFMTSLSRQPADGPNLPISSTWYHHNRPKPPTHIKQYTTWPYIIQHFSKLCSFFECKKEKEKPELLLSIPSQNTNKPTKKKKNKRVIIN